MRVSIHQPQYLPWLPYFQKIEESDLFIFLDNVDFQKNGLQNRNQIKSSSGYQWLTVPVKQSLGQKIVDTRVVSSNNWRKKHWQTIRQNYSKALAFDQYKEELEQIYLRDWDQLSSLNIKLTGLMLEWLGINTNTQNSSQMKATGSASELILNLCLEVGATHYLSGTGGLNYLQLDEFKKAGITVDIQSMVLPNQYPQRFLKAGFINDLSALDLILNCGNQWRKYL
jgi:hypothetical protein